MPGYEYFVKKEIDLKGRSEEEQTRIILEAEFEAKTMKKLNHPNIIKILKKPEKKGNQKVVIFMELAEGGSLSHQIKSRSRKQEDVEYFSERQVMFWFVQTLMAVAYMHDPKQGRDKNDPP